MPTRKYKGGANRMCNLQQNVPNEIPILFHNGSKTLKNTKPFQFQEKKEIRKIDENNKDNVTTISYKIQFIDSARIMASSLSNLVNNLAEGIHKIKCKYEHDNKKRKTCGII